MELVSWSNFRGGRNKRGGFGKNEDLYKLDPDKSTKRNTFDILQSLCRRPDVFYDITSLQSGNFSPTFNDDVPTAKGLSKTIISDVKRLSYLNALVKLLSKDETRQKIGFTTEELLCCLRVCLVHDATQVRAGTLRAVRYILRNEADVVAFNSLRLPYLVTRCMDVALRNEIERVQALRVVRRALRLAASICEAALARALAAAPDDKDRMLRACLAALCELGVLNPSLFILTGGVTALTRAILDCQTPRIAESLCGVLLYLLNDPRTRVPAKVDFRCLAAPYCDFHYRHGWMDKNRDEREMRFTCSRLSLLSVLRSWPGLLHFCDPLNESGLRAIVDVLYLNQLEVRKALLDLLYELLGLPQPEWTDELSVALQAVDPSDFQDSWRLSDGFVAAEGLSILPHLAGTGPNLTELHLALLLYCFLEVGLLDALVEVMVTSDTFISVRATVLLGQLLHLIHLLLPPETCNISPPLPSLLSARHPQALAAVAALQNLNSLLKSRPASNSLFLDHILQYCDTSAQYPEKEEAITKLPSPKAASEPVKGLYKYREDSFDLLNDADYEIEQSQRRSLGSRNDYSQKNESVLVKSKSVSSRTNLTIKEVVRMLNVFNNFKENDTLIKDSNVLQDRSGFSWDWNIIRAILKVRNWGIEHTMVARRLVYYLKPQSNLFSHTDLQLTSPKTNRDQALAAVELVTFLLSSDEAESADLLRDLFVNINSHMDSITLSRSAHDCLFSPQHMATTMCQMYFLLIGRLCATLKGLQVFKESGLADSLLHLSTTTHHTCYVKLIVSSLNYTIDSYPRQILTETLQCDMEPSRLYATQFLNVLLRARQKAGEMNSRHYGSPRKKVYQEPPYPESADFDVSRAWVGSNQPKPEICSDMDGWLLELLIKQARDKSKSVSLSALNSLDEACNVPVYLNKLVAIKPRLKDLGDKGYLLWVRFAGTPMGFQALVDAGYVQRQINYWVKHYNYRYARLVDGDIHDCLTLLQRSEDGRYSRRHSSARAVTPKEAPLPTHLYGQLVLHLEGVLMLERYADIPILVQRVRLGLCSTEQDVMDLKAALWACGHIATSNAGIDLLVAGQMEGSSVFADTVKLAQNCQVYSIRGTAFYVLGLMGCTYKGANVLYELGWLCVRHDRHDRWPIIYEDDRLTKTASEDQIYENLYRQPSRMERRVTVDTETSETSDKTDHSATDSFHSDTTKLLAGKLSTTATSATIECSLTEESCDSCEGEGEDQCDEKTDGEKPNTRSVSESSGMLKCKTLPQRLNPGSRKHQRSLSESKTVDKLKSDNDPGDIICDRMLNLPRALDSKLMWRLESVDQWREGMLRRIRNISESSTSGVSSCDSVLGKYVYNSDRVTTLSPIPSSSSLSAMKSVISYRRHTEATRRISLHSYTGSDVASSPPSQRDLVGYATMRTLRGHHRRLMYTEAGVDEFDTFIRPQNAYPPSSVGKISSNARNTLSRLKSDWKPISTSSDPRWSSQSQVKDPGKSQDTDTPRLMRGIPTKCRRPPPVLRSGPCYMGISMPRCLLDIFPTTNYALDTSEANYRTGDDSIAMDLETGNQQDTAVKKNDDSNFNSSFSDLSIGNGAKASSKASRGRSRERFTIHDQQSCLYCARLKPTDVRKAADLREIFFAGMDSPKPYGSGSMKSGVYPKCKSPAPTNSLTYASLDVSCGSPNSLDSNLSKMSDGNPNVTEEILKHSERMGNPVWHKQSKQSLLELKQKYPESFQNVCLYSEICKLVSQSTYRLIARRFLQELFLDLNFDLFYLEPQQILQTKFAELEISEKD